ncbi:hypothetical protein J4421_03965 [Candidatus Woesearchaeota archaeon]|nr:hypothetical protein [Candidatus Woesearchaeota archaeon]
MSHAHGGSNSSRKKGGEKKPSNIDELMEGLHQEHSTEIKEAFEAHDKWHKKEHQNHIYNKILTPAQEELYKGVKEKIGEVFDDEDSKLHNKKDEIKKVVTHGLKKYFEKAKPSVGKILEDMNMDEDEQYEFLTTFYDDHVGVDPSGRRDTAPSIKGFVELAKNKKSTAGDIVRTMYELKPKYVASALNRLNNRHTTHHFLKYDNTAIAAYLKPEIEKQGFEIEDKVGYATAEHGELLRLRKAVIEKEGEEFKYLKKKGDDSHGGDKHHHH